MQTPDKQRNIPERFRVARPTLLFDKFMTQFIKVGGLSIILAVTLIFVFIFIQVWPLFKGATVQPLESHALPDNNYIALGVDEWRELPFLVTDQGRIFFFDAVDLDSEHNRGWFEAKSTLPADSEVTAIRYNQRDDTIAIGLADGRFTVLELEFKASFPPGRAREVQANITTTPLLKIGPDNAPIIDVDYGDSGTRKVLAAIQRDGDQLVLNAAILNQARTLFGVGEVEVGKQFKLTQLLTGLPKRVLVNWEADTILVQLEDGRVDFLRFENGEFVRRQSFKPFEGMNDPTIASMDFVLGDVSVVFSNPDGEMRVWSIYRDDKSNQRIFGETKTFPTIDHGGATFHSMSKRNKAFLTGHDDFASLRYLTTENIRWEDTLPFQIKLALIAPRYNSLYFLDDQNQLHIYDLDDKHPIAGWKTYFGKIQYEGQSEPSFSWQSTGGRDDFERKLSMVPLLIGTLKGTVYALIFALPIAILAALYTSQFLQPGIKRYVKPIMEIMASLPSVVLGFVAALWLAPILSNAVPSMVFACIGLVIGSLGFGYLWSRLPNHIRLTVKPGVEFLVVVPALLLLTYLGWQLGPLVESMFFVVTDPDSGRAVADFRLWFVENTGLAFEQRNAFVVGFVMGFAVIPIIFTISEDAMSNVPDAFRSGSLALGASRWQTAIRIVLPTASAGIFSALMIGFGRAVGETMIVVMATGNVPVTEFNPFTGMRTLSANIAVELPEAPHLGTLYRTLFLGAMLLFLLTFFVNTIAEVMRQRLRERYKAVE